MIDRCHSPIFARLFFSSSLPFARVGEACRETGVRTSDLVRGREGCNYYWRQLSENDIYMMEKFPEIPSSPIFFYFYYRITRVPREL